ncbi:hypothetical protein ACFQ6Q_10680 [Streptomyces sp. NPDC056437]|uniref:hypothetical protein n=1 Tax=Streptomyces sp. NPDC056437 TaxID=3345816 RepID=UPI00367C7B17
MANSTEIWMDTGSGPGAVYTVSALLEQRVVRFYRAFLDHVKTCSPCQVLGVDCIEAADIRVLLRDARESAGRADS